MSDPIDKMTENLEGVFKNGYGYIPKAVMKDRDLSIQSKAVYSYLCSYAGRDGQAFPSRKLMCYDLNISQDSLNKHLKELIKYGFISKYQSRAEGNKFANNIYIIKYDLDIEIPLQNVSVKEISGDGESVNGNLVTTNNNNNTNNNINNNNNNNINRENKNSLQEFKSITNNTKKYLTDNQLKELVEKNFIEKELQELVYDFLNTKKGKNKTYEREEQFNAFVNSLNDLDYKSKKECLRYSIRNDYPDIYPEKYKSQKKERKEYSRTPMEEAMFENFLKGGWHK